MNMDVAVWSRTLIVGMGEVGTAHYKVLAPHYNVQVRDVGPATIISPIDIMHVAIPSPTNLNVWLGTVDSYIDAYKPAVIDILTTVPPGTCRKLGPNVVHSTTRGLHPNLDLGLTTITKHIGGPKAPEVAAYFRKAGVSCVAHLQPETTELCHILHNISYGVSLMFADEAARICRQYGVDYIEYMRYLDTHNAGWQKLDHSSKIRQILTPPNGHIGGHCIVQNAQMLAPRLKDSPLVSLLADYNKEKK